MAIGFFKSLVQKFTGRPVDWDELEETLIRADLGVPLTLEILTTLQTRRTTATAEDVVDVTRAAIQRLLPPASRPSDRCPPSPRPF